MKTRSPTRPAFSSHALACALLAFCCAAPQLSAATLTERLDETYPLAPGGRLTLENVNGSVTLETWERAEVRIEAEKRVRSRSRNRAEEAMDELRVEIREGGGSLDIETHHPRSGITGWIFGGDVSARVEYRLTVPKSISLELVTVNGKVTGSGPEGTLRVRTTNGDVELRDASGEADIRTTNGSIRAELLSVPTGSDLRFVTTNGGIQLALPSSLGASVEASTTNGTIDTDFPIQLTGRLSRRKLSGEINGGGGRLELRTTNGSIRISES